MKISQKFVAFSEYMNFNEINKYLGRKIHRVNEFIFFFKFGVRTICLTYAYLIRAKKSSRFTVRRPHKRRTGLILVTSLRPQESQGCQKIRFFFSQIKLLSFCANIAPKKHKLQKTIKIVF